MADGDIEWAVRLELAACFRLLAHYGLDDLIFTHASATLPGSTRSFLLNPCGLLFDEITASSLVRVDDGEPRDGAEVNPGALVTHTAIHRARPDAGAAIHTHTVAGIAVSAQEGGLRPVSQMALGFLGQVAYHDYGGYTTDVQEGARLAASLGDRSALIMRNHGLLTLGRTVADAFHATFFLNKACEIQVASQGGGRLVAPDPGVRANLARPPSLTYGNAGPAWRALVRALDARDPGYRA